MAVNAFNTNCILRIRLGEKIGLKKYSAKLFRPKAIFAGRFPFLSLWL